MVAVTGRIEGRDLGSTVADVRKRLDQPGFLKPGVSYTLGGLYQQQQIAFAGLAKVFLAAAAAEFLLLPRAVLKASCWRRQSWRPRSCRHRGFHRAMADWDRPQHHRDDGDDDDHRHFDRDGDLLRFGVSAAGENDAGGGSPVEASRKPAASIAMTTSAAILTLLPLAFAIGQGSAMQQPLAVAIIAGLLLQFPMVLLVLPVAIGRLAHAPRQTRPVSPGTSRRSAWR